MKDFWFKSNLFKVEPGEDEETNPQCYGKELAGWLKKKFELLGYEVEDVIPEDWGWCVMCQRQPYWLWVGCGSIVETENVETENAERTSPKSEEIYWHCFVVAEVSFFKKILRKIDTSEGIRKLVKELETILTSESGITLVDESCVP